MTVSRVFWHLWVSIFRKWRFAEGLLLLSVLGTACAAPAEQQAQSGLAASRAAEAFAHPDSNERADTAGFDGTLGAYVAYALKNNPELEARFDRWQAEVYRISRARRLPDPVISYAYYIRRVETRVGPQRHKVSLRQTFPWPSQLSAGADAAAARSRAEQERFDAMAVSVAARVEQAYWRIWQIEESRKIQQEHEAVLSALAESADAMVMTGRMDLADLQQIELTRARVEDSLATLDEQHTRQEAELRSILSAPTNLPLPITSKPDFHTEALDESALLAAVKSHPSLRAYDALARSSAKEAQKEEATRYPNFTFSFDWIETGAARNPDTPDSGKDALIAGVGISIPVWQRNYQNGVEAYHAEEKAHLADKEAATNQAVARFYQTLSQIRDAERRIALYEHTLVPQAESVYASVLGAYAGGKGSAAAILLAQQALLELRLQLIDAQSDYLNHRANLENLAGTERRPKEDPTP